MAKAMLSIQIIPKASSEAGDNSFVDKAIAVIEESGVKYQVNPFETTMEGELPELFSIVEKMNEKMIEAGSESVISEIKVLYQPSGASMDDLTKKYR